MNEQIIPGKSITLCPAAIHDRQDIYQWLAHSDITHYMIGPPTYPDDPIPSWKEFLDDYTPNYFDDSEPLQGRCYIILAGGDPVGQINYNQILGPDDDRRVELDIWLRSEADCGRGYGPDALDALCQYLHQKFAVQEFLVRPSARNPRAIHAYKKAGFARVDFSLEQIRDRWGVGEYTDGVCMIKRIPPFC
ncbi:MAG: GNAT family N-acetyltransferase [Anaerolineales bacterium]|nr:GNAT family N-acetyltransferase [Anaerolineales bacterium]